MKEIERKEGGRMKRVKKRSEKRGSEACAAKVL